MSSRRVVFTTFGSLGDLHPYLAVARELMTRGHRPAVATLARFRERVESAGLEFLPLRGAVTEEPTPELMRRVLLRRTGIEYIIRELLMPALRTAYEDTQAASEGADLLVSHPLTLPTRLVAETRGLPWVSTQLAPSGFVSAFDPPLFPGMAWMARFHPPVTFYRWLFQIADKQSRRWLRPYDLLRQELGLPDAGNPLFTAAHSPHGELALFSKLLASPQPDWPPQTLVTGFSFFNQHVPANARLEEWLSAGPPPVIFTLGSSAVITPGNFFKESATAARQLGVRALLLGMAETEENQMRADVFSCGYAAYSQVFNRGAAIVHQGGVGTTAEAMRAGKPMLVVPFGVDQPDNAARVSRLGIAGVLRRSRYTAKNVATALRPLLQDRSYADRAAIAGRTVSEENGAGAAADAIEAMLAS